MRVVLGIDAAWTDVNPSGFALAVESSSGWKLLATAPSYQVWHELAHGEISLSSASLPDATVLLQTTQKLVGFFPTLVAIDMPLAHLPICGRRTSDNAVSKAYGSRKCATHSPSSIRPGKISDTLREGFAEAGYPLHTQIISGQGLIEVYPHPALVELSGDHERLPYKLAKIGKYWNSLTREERRYRLYKVWLRIETLLEDQLPGTVNALPKIDATSSTRELKAYEDTLDAIICVWVGICALEGRAVALGDAESAIWIPKPLYSNKT